jgi:hypothetical protein
MPIYILQCIQTFCWHMFTVPRITHVNGFICEPRMHLMQCLADLCRSPSAIGAANLTKYSLVCSGYIVHGDISSTAASDTHYPEITMAPLSDTPSVAAHTAACWGYFGVPLLALPKHRNCKPASSMNNRRILLIKVCSVKHTRQAEGIHPAIPHKSGRNMLD